MDTREIAVAVILAAWITTAALCIVRLQRSARRRQTENGSTLSRG